MIYLAERFGWIMVEIRGEKGTSHDLHVEIMANQLFRKDFEVDRYLCHGPFMFQTGRIYA